MARYINLDEAIKYLHNDCKAKYPLSYANGLDASINELIKLPTADVVPKSEVERLTVELDAMRGAANTYKMHYENAMKEIERLKDYNTGVAFKHYFDGRKEVAREIFEEIEEMLNCLKKYTEDK